MDEQRSSRSQPTRYRKKPVVIEAEQFDPRRAGPLPFAGAEDPVQWDHDAGWYIDTLEGRMKLSMGDWVIKGVQGEFYPCKPDIFEATYEAVQ